jgi:hypothetical protein
MPLPYAAKRPEGYLCEICFERPATQSWDRTHTDMSKYPHHLCKECDVTKRALIWDYIDKSRWATLKDCICDPPYNRHPHDKCCNCGPDHKRNDEKAIALIREHERNPELQEEWKKTNCPKHGRKSDYS